MTPLSQEVQEQIEFTALAVYPVNLLDGNPDIDLNDYSRSSWISGATWYAEKLAEKDARIKELEKEVERLRREIGEVALAGLALGNKANQGNG